MKFFDFIDRKTLLLGLFIHIIIAFFSMGFIHPDEQYYALDFAFYKLGLLENYNFSWEYESGIRPFSLPFIFFSIGKVTGVENLFTLSTILRIVSTVFSFGAGLVFLKGLFEKFNYKSDFLIKCFFFAWPILLMHARTNSENWSTSMLLLALGMAFLKLPAFIVGLLMGLTFYLRFQMGFMIAPIYFLLYGKDIKNYSVGAIALLLACGGLFFTDVWGYGSNTFTPFNYFYVNLVEDKVSTFGVSPWWWYGAKTITKLLPLWGLALFMSYFAAFKFLRKDKVLFFSVIATLPFLLVHSAIGHKEFRFIYPVLPLCFVILDRLIKNKFFFQNILLKSNVIVIPFLLIPVYKPMIIYKYLYNSEIEKVYFISQGHPFDMKPLLKKGFQFEKLSENKPDSFYLVTQNFRELSEVEKNYKCETLEMTYPKWVMKFNVGGWVQRSNIWSVNKCEK